MKIMAQPEPLHTELCIHTRGTTHTHIHIYIHMDLPAPYPRTAHLDRKIEGREGESHQTLQVLLRSMRDRAVSCFHVITAMATACCAIFFTALFISSDLRASSERSAAD